ncbi:MAG: YihY/virulence factor BrkB family protein [Porticoccaceae bacterium]|nr:YihY/virulence factor BrkB family protein [Porticoccaceae bacterium]
MQNPANAYGRIKSFLHDELWRTDLTTLSVPARVGFAAVRLLWVLSRDLSSGQLTLRAMSLVYTTLLSLVPLLAVSFSVLKAFGVHNQIEPLLINLVQPLGEKGNELVMNVLGFVENMKVGVLGSVGLALLLYTVIALIQKIENAFNHVWHAKTSRSLSRRFSDYLSVIMVGPVLVFSAMGMTASMMNSALVQTLAAMEPFGSLLLLASKLVPFLLIFLAFTFVYLFIPNTRVKLVSAMSGAVVGSILWQLSGVVFAEFAASSTNYAAIYSGFAIVILFMIWLYLSWLILLIGAQVAYYHQYPEQLKFSGEHTALSGHLREQLGLLVMYWVAYKFVHEELPPTLETLTRLMGIPSDRIGETLQMLEDRGLVVESNSHPPEYLLSHDPSSLCVADLLAIMRKPLGDAEVTETQVQSVAAVDHLMEQIETATRDHLAGMTLRELVLNKNTTATDPN